MLVDALNLYLMGASLAISSLILVLLIALKRSHGQLFQLELARALESTSREIYLFNADTLELIDANRSASRHLGYSEKELRSLRLTDLHPSAFTRHLTKLISTMRHENKCEEVYQSSIICRDGSVYPIEAHMHYTKENDNPILVLIASSVSERKIAEEMRRRAEITEELSEGLEQRVRARTAALESEKAKLEQLNQVKSDFVNVVSHELRTPLTSIKSFAEILRSDLDELDKETKLHFLSIIDNEAARLNRLINDLLDLQRLDSGRMIWRDTDQQLNMLINESIDFFSTAFKNKNIALISTSPSEGDFAIVIDPDKVKQIMANILSNALKFTRQGSVTVGLTRIESCGDEQNEPCYRIQITDTGAGIPGNELDKIFERFHQVKDSVSEVAGSGLGLAICREYVEHYQGNISVSSTLNQGTTFTIDLPPVRLEKKRLGEILIDAGLVTDHQIKEALKQQSTSRK